jgi:transcriptional regulator with XRE-family HTH domain
MVYNVFCQQGVDKARTEVMNRVREYLKKMREEKGLSMQDVADKIGISRQYYQMIENGERQRKMDITLVKSIANIFNVTLETIIENENNIKEDNE